MQKLPIAGARPLFILTLALSSLAWSANANADAFSELAAFSGMQGVDDGKLAGGKVITARGPAMNFPSGLAVQACYLMPLPLQKAAEFHKQWTASRHPELKVYLHRDLPSKPALADFQNFAGVRDSSAVQSLVAATEKLNPGKPELQMSFAEAKLFSKTTAGGGGGSNAGPIPPAVAAFWSNLLYQRTLAYLAGGVSREPAYEGSGETVRPSEEIARILKEQPKLREEFKPVLDDSGLTGGNGNLTPSLFFELLDVEGRAAFTSGAAYSKPVKDGWQGLDLQFYSSDGYYVLLTLCRFWPVTTPSGQQATLVWRGDLLSSAAMADLHSNVERLGSTGAMMKEIQKNIGFLLQDAAGRK
jgi:hypothetical protein